MAFRIERADTAFSLSPTKQKRPRKKDDAHLNAIRMLPCVVCLKRPVEAAHIRTGSLIHGKRETGISEKPGDEWVLPLCPAHHSMQHGMNELVFYEGFEINPFATALALWAAEADEERMAVIIQQARVR